MVGQGCFKAYLKCWAFNAWRPLLANKRHGEKVAQLEAANSSLRHHIGICESKLQNMEQQLRLVQALKPKGNEVTPWPQLPVNVPRPQQEDPKHDAGGAQRNLLPFSTDPASAAEASRIWERDQALLRDMLQRGQGMK